MAHSVEEAYLDNEAINKYLEVLTGYIKEAGIGEHRILVVGGAVMALKYVENRATVDIDICIREQNYFDDAVLYRIYQDMLSVYVVADLDLYCMKIVSFRPKDVQDMEKLQKFWREDA